MLYSSTIRPAALTLLLGLGACSLDLNERPNANNDATASTVPAATLQEVRWVLVELDGQPATAAAETPYLVLQGGRARAEGRAGCNKFSGPYKLAEAGRLRLGPLVTTRSICPDQATEISFLQALNQAQQYRISGSTLRLYAADTLGTPLARLKAVAAE
ncbi:META domain-containing protein [Hymenobacter cellulosivorans]|uniref:META domain-containing protein n=1 Tax=Hymenobacter cellulosivorans TaxID=2932249 RepID=A0ABY4F6U2_9BACT|nr:META domain-containing protein [Hymenobacter cellulosivorans]UOQ52258.1 META domain-containing protein [Hymenobacter cellulosivorans]